MRCGPPREDLPVRAEPQNVWGSNARPCKTRCGNWVSTGQTALQECSREAHSRSIAFILGAFDSGQRRGVRPCPATKIGLDLFDGSRPTRHLWRMIEKTKITSNRFNIRVRYDPRIL